MCQKCNSQEHAEIVTTDAVEPFEYHSERKLYSSPVGELTQEARNKIQGIIHLWEVHIDVSGKGLIPPVETIADFVETWQHYEYTQSYIYEMFNGNIKIKHNQGYTMGIPPLHPVSADTEEKRQANRLKLAQQWHRFLSDCYGMTTSPNTEYRTVKECVELTLAETETKGQSFAKRLGKRLAKSGRKLSKAQIETINNLAEAGTTKPKSEWIAFDDDYLTGRPGDYGNSRSCWWQSGDYSAGRPSLHDAGGFACRTFDEHGKFAGGRCWIVPVPEGHLIFNAYGLQLKEFAKLLSSMWKCHYVSVDVDRPTDIYINGDDGFILGMKEKLPRDGDTYAWDVEVIDGDDGLVECEDCSSRIDPDYSYSDPNGNCLCESCFDDRYSHCSNCSETFDRDDIYECGSRYYCESCAESRGWVRCNDCSEWHNDGLVTSDGESVCSDCLDNYTCCEGCSGYFANSECEVSPNDDCSYCCDCMPELEGEQFCQATGEVIDSDHIDSGMWDTPAVSSRSHCPVLSAYGSGVLPVRADCISDLADRINRGDDVTRFPELATLALALCLAGF